MLIIMTQKKVSLVCSAFLNVTSAQYHLELLWNTRVYYNKYFLTGTKKYPAQHTIHPHYGDVSCIQRSVLIHDSWIC